MRKSFSLVGLVCLVGLVFHVGCSRESREEAMVRMTKAGRALNGDVRPNDVEHEVPNVVIEQQRRERIRQNTMWTADNRALHPIEYCQAQLEELEKHDARLEVVAHEVATKKAEVVRTMGNHEGRLKNLEKFLGEAKATYRVCETNNVWPAQLGGFSLSKGKVREKIVDAARQISVLRTRIGTQRNQLVQLEKKADLVWEEQKRLAALRERVETTLSDLKLKKVIDGKTGISDSLNAIHDAMGSLGVDYDDPKLDDIFAPDRKSAIDEDFDRIMAE